MKFLIQKSLLNPVDSVLTAIKKLPNLSYENGKTTIVEIDNKLQTIQTDAGKNTVDFQKLSDNSQKEYEKVINQIQKIEEEQRRKASSGYYYEKYGGYSHGVKPFFTPPNVEQGMMVEYRLYQRTKQDLELLRQNLPNTIVLTNMISKLSDNLEKRINLAKQKSGNVKDYADALQSFSDPDMLGEISELDKFIADLTNNLPLAS
ncbi:MAG: hypothetical protein NT070_19110 [Cyanobacteria bacterium]|nr:hypothetical protein [Cyanobacteriota bacterium]